MHHWHIVRYDEHAPGPAALVTTRSRAEARRAEGFADRRAARGLPPITVTACEDEECGPPWERLELPLRSV